MKKIIFLFAITFLASSFLGAQELVLKKQTLNSTAKEFLKHKTPQTREQEEYLSYMDLYEGGLAWTSGFGGTKDGTYYASACIDFTAIQMEPYVGGVLSEVSIPIPSGIPGLAAAESKVWIKGSLTSAVLYEQTFTPTVGGWTDVTLTTPYTITSGSLVIGFTIKFVVTGAGSNGITVYTYWLEDELEHAYEPGGCNYTKFETSPSYGEGANWIINSIHGNLGIVGIVDGVTLPENDLSAILIKKANTNLVQVNQPSSVTVSVKNTGLEDQNNYTVQVLDASDNILATKTVTTALQPYQTTHITLNYTTPVNGGAHPTRGKVILSSDNYLANNVSTPGNLLVYPMQPMAYCIDSDDNALGSTGTGSVTYHAVIEYKQADLGPFSKKLLTAVDVFFETKNLTNCSVWIRNTKTGANQASKTFTPARGWNRVVFDTPYVIGTDKDIFIGFSVTGTKVSPLSCSTNAPANMVTGGNIALGSTWYNLTDIVPNSNLLIVGVVEGSCQPVTNLKVEYNEDCSAKLSWDAPGGATKFNVYRGIEKIADNITTTFFTDEGNAVGQGYTWSVTVVCDDESGESSPASKTLPACMDKPASVTGVAVVFNDDCQAEITWNASPTATYYKVSRGTTLLKDSLTTTSFLDTENDPTEVYTWAVRACNPAGESNPSIKAMAACAVPPAPVAGLKVVFNAECDKATLTWTATTSPIALGYKILRDTTELGTVEIMENPTFIDEDFENEKHTWAVVVFCKYDLASKKATVEGVCTGVKDQAKTAFTIVPNPATNQITISAVNPFHTIDIVNFLGQSVFTQPNIGNTAKVDVSGLSNGVYFLRLISDHGANVQKFVKQ